MTTTGIDAILEMLAGCGVRHLFGNPGSTELPMMDSLAAKARLEFILGLQEVPVMAMADGYAQATRTPGVVNLHVACGLGNAMGMLHNAHRSGTPLIVTAGQQDQRMMFEEPILWNDMLSVAKPWCKWAAEVTQIQDVPSAVRRAVQVAMTPPTGPVFLSLPLDVQMGRAELDLTPPQLPNVHVRPPVEAVRRAAQVLAEARNPGVLVGSRICEADAIAELVAVAERLGAAVLHEAATSHGRSSFPSTHPLCGEPLPYWSPDIRQRLEEFDVLLVAGMKVMQLYIHKEPARAIPEHIRLVQVDDDPWELGKNYPVEVGVLGHPKPSLAELAQLLDTTMTRPAVEAAQRRGQARAESHEADRQTARREAQSQASARPMTPLTVLDSMARVLPDNAAVVEESPSTPRCYFERIGALKDPTGYFGHRGWALGWGMNCAIGVQLAWPDRPVLAMLGDGSALYGVQGLWSAAHYRIPVTFVVINNREYRILKRCAEVMDLPQANAGRFLGMDLDNPPVDYVGLAQSFGVNAVRVTEPDELRDAVSESLAADTPRLIEVRVGQG